MARIRIRIKQSDPDPGPYQIEKQDPDPANGYTCYFLFFIASGKKMQIFYQCTDLSTQVKQRINSSTNHSSKGKLLCVVTDYLTPSLNGSNLSVLWLVTEKGVYSL
jgi:hypothetical protein